MISLALYGAVVSRDVRWRDGVDRAGPGLEQAAAAHAAVAGRVHRDEGAHRAGPRRRLGARGEHRRLAHPQGVDAGLPVGRERAVRLGRLAAVRRVRPVPGLPAADRERHAADVAAADAAVLRRRPVHPAQPVPAHDPDIAKFTPLYGLNQLVHAPMLGNGVRGPGWSTCSSGWRSSSAARCGGSARTPRASDHFRQRLGVDRDVMAPIHAWSASPGVLAPASRGSARCRAAWSASLCSRHRERGADRAISRLARTPPPGNGAGRSRPAT